MSRFCYVVRGIALLLRREVFVPIYFSLERDGLSSTMSIVCQYFTTVLSPKFPMANSARGGCDYLPH